MLLPFELSDQLSFAGVVVALAGFFATTVFTVMQLARSERTSRGQFLQSLQQLSAPLAETEMRLRPARVSECWPATANDWQEVDRFLSFFEYCAVLIRNGSLRVRDFESFFLTRLENCLSRPDIAFAKLSVEAAHWRDLLWLIRKCGLSRRLTSSLELFRQYHIAGAEGRPWLDILSRMSPAELADCRRSVEGLVAYAAAKTMDESALTPKIRTLIETAVPTASGLSERRLTLQVWSAPVALSRFGALREQHAAILLANWVIPHDPLSIDAKLVLARLIADAGHGRLLAAWVKHAEKGGQGVSSAPAIGRAIFGGSLFPERSPAVTGRASQLPEARTLVDQVILELGDRATAQDRLKIATFITLTEMASRLGSDAVTLADDHEGSRLVYASKLTR